MALSIIKREPWWFFYDVEHFPNKILGCDVISLKTSAI